LTLWPNFVQLNVNRLHYVLSNEKFNTNYGKGGTMSTIQRGLFFCVFVVTLSASVAMADYVWTGSGDGTKWSDPNNWRNSVTDVNEVPKQAGNTVINIDANIVLDSNAGNINSFYIGNGDITLTIASGGSLTGWGDFAFGIWGGTKTATLNIEPGGVIVNHGNLLIGMDTSKTNMTIKGALTVGQFHVYYAAQMPFVNIVGDGVFTSDMATEGNINYYIGNGGIVANGGASSVSKDVSSGKVVLIATPIIVPPIVSAFTFDTDLEGWKILRGGADASLVWRANTGGGEMLLSYQDNGSGTMDEVAIGVTNISIDPKLYHYVRIKYKCTGWPMQYSTTFHVRYSANPTNPEIPLNGNDLGLLGFGVGVGLDPFPGFDPAANDFVSTIYAAWAPTEEWAWSKEWRSLTTVGSLGLVFPDWRTDQRANPSLWNGASIAIDSIEFLNTNPVGPTCFAENANKYDLNKDCIVDLLDFSIIAGVWLENTYETTGP
jgi:hypothetical protein